MAKLVRNALKCLTCGTTIESLHRHDYVKCDCPYESDTGVYVDGGLLYQRVGYGIKAEFEDLSEYED
jgi:hypothetical protein